jgi:hypothetical protein
VGGKAIVPSLHSSLERTGTERERQREKEKTRRTPAGVDMSYETGNNVTYMTAHRNKVFKILHFNS